MSQGRRLCASARLASRAAQASSRLALAGRCGPLSDQHTPASLAERPLTATDHSWGAIAEWAVAAERSRQGLASMAPGLSYSEYELCSERPRMARTAAGCGVGWGGLALLAGVVARFPPTFKRTYRHTEQSGG